MKILYVRINDKIGDTVIETAFYRELKRLFPRAHLTVMCCGPQPLLRTIPYIDDFLFLPPHGVAKIAGAFCKCPHSWLHPYDLLISFTPHWRMRVLNAALRARRKETFCLPDDRPVFEAYAAVLKKLGATKINPRYELHLPPEALAAADAFLVQCGLAGKPFLFFNPAGGSPRRTLGQGRVREILRGLHTLPVVLCNVTGRYEARGQDAFIWQEKNILHTAALISRAAYVLTVDTCVAHIAETFGKPMTVLFSLKNYEREAQKGVSLLKIWGPRTGAKKLYAVHFVDEISSGTVVKKVLAGWAYKK